VSCFTIDTLAWQWYFAFCANIIVYIILHIPSPVHDKKRVSHRSDPNLETRQSFFTFFLAEFCPPMVSGRYGPRGRAWGTVLRKGMIKAFGRAVPNTWDAPTNESLNAQRAELQNLPRRSRNRAMSHPTRASAGHSPYLALIQA
jgi:hypothetical protein